MSIESRIGRYRILIKIIINLLAVTEKMKQLAISEELEKIQNQLQIISDSVKNLREQIIKRNCPKCNYRLLFPYKFCPDCGHKL